MKILVVDDDAMAAEMVAAVLQELGHSVVLAEHAMQAVECLQAEPEIALIVSDMHMPLLSGIELFQELRAQGCQLPFILLTGDEPGTLFAQEPHLDACLAKDFSLPDALPTTLAQVLARARSGPRTSQP